MTNRLTWGETVGSDDNEFTEDNIMDFIPHETNSAKNSSILNFYIARTTQYAELTRHASDATVRNFQARFLWKLMDEEKENKSLKGEYFFT